MDEREFTRLMAERAKVHQDGMRGMADRAAFAYISKIVADSDVVAGIWPEPGASYDVGIHPIKGRRRLEAIKVSGVLDELRLNAVPCNSREQAIAAEQVFGDKVN